MFVDHELFIDAYDGALTRKNLTAVDAIKASVDYYYNKLVSKNDQRLLDLAFQDNVTQQQLDDFLSTWDIEAEGSAKALLLSYFMKKHPTLVFNEYTGPRLKGVLNFCKFGNLSLISHYSKIGHALNEHNIIPMIMKGGVMKYLRPDLPRHMGDIDILIFDDKDYEDSKKIVLDLGYEYDEQPHSIDLHMHGSDAGILDIHTYIDLDSKYDKRKILNNLKKRAAKKTVFGVETYVPCAEDLLFISMVNLVKNIRNKTSVHGVLFNLFDFEYLKNSKPDFDWNIILDNIRLTKTYSQMVIAIEFANRLVPGILPDFLSHDKTMQRSVQRYFERDVYYSKYVYDIRAKSGKTKMRNVHSMRDFFKYLNIKLTKQFRWFVLQHPTLIRIWLKIASKRGDK